MLSTITNGGTAWKYKSTWVGVNGDYPMDVYYVDIPLPYGGIYRTMFFPPIYTAEPYYAPVSETKYVFDVDKPVQYVTSLATAGEVCRRASFYVSYNPGVIRHVIVAANPTTYLTISTFLKLPGTPSSHKVVTLPSNSSNDTCQCYYYDFPCLGGGTQRICEVIGTTQTGSTLPNYQLPLEWISTFRPAFIMLDTASAAPYISVISGSNTFNVNRRGNTFNGSFTLFLPTPGSRLHSTSVWTAATSTLQPYITVNYYDQLINPQIIKRTCQIMPTTFGGTNYIPPSSSAWAKPIGNLGTKYINNATPLLSSFFSGSTTVIAKKLIVANNFPSLTELRAYYSSEFVLYFER
jgi:hypothetical protein